ncbi:methyltransferase family protein [Herbihabitans rhizosphaerae]|uniref:Methyltransferase family protein n=1 Tax=Herbihabitans rhizosphaerae TaxID=1872711 RepID=A0A4Q7KG12_9PSEU|nr:class I SAM-dependent methyltransferase [Herbihabitans rhizosphaerae]RZS32832.1 methyltransferase family protein [Herbihabitans rhizosphaerae]
MGNVWQSRTIGRLNGAIYDRGIENERIAKLAGGLLWATDVGQIFEAMRAPRSLPDGAAVLDVPCGGGIAIKHLGVVPDLRYVAADISVDMLNRARKRAEEVGVPDVEFVEASIEHLPFADGEFDMCLCFNGLHCLPDPPAAVTEIARCLRAGGRLVGDMIVRGAGLRFDLNVAGLRTIGAFGPGGTADDLAGWLTTGGLRIETLTLSGAVAHFEAVKPG